MSVSLTLDAVRARTKTVTRRHVDTWRDLDPGDRITLIEKGMGLPKGAKQVIVAVVEIVDVRREPLNAITQDDVRREGFPTASPVWFVDFFCDTHKGCTPETEVTRIEWRYLDAAAVDEFDGDTFSVGPAVSADSTEGAET